MTSDFVPGLSLSGYNVRAFQKQFLAERDKWLNGDSKSLFALNPLIWARDYARMIRIMTFFNPKESTLI